MTDFDGTSAVQLSTADSGFALQGSRYTLNGDPVPEACGRQLRMTKSIFRRPIL